MAASGCNRFTNQNSNNAYNKKTSNNANTTDIYMSNVLFLCGLRAPVAASRTVANPSKYFWVLNFWVRRNVQTNDHFMLCSTFDHVYSQIFSKKMGAHFFSCVEGPNDVESQNLQ